MILWKLTHPHISNDDDIVAPSRRLKVIRYRLYEALSLQGKGSSHVFPFRKLIRNLITIVDGRQSHIVRGMLKVSLNSG